ncbi:MAG: EAL and GGDEF domain-containing protein [Alphaproteobacteria bacterium]|nr:EAL and GGDEF domain-containing protein [Alphaproteobacteria bacterium]
MGRSSSSKAGDHMDGGPGSLPPQWNASPWGAPLPPRWAEMLAGLDVAFQPIVDIRTGNCFGYETSLYEKNKTGYDDINTLCDWAHGEGVLPAFLAQLHAKMASCFVRLPHYRKTRLFVVLDARVLVKETVGTNVLEPMTAIAQRFSLPEKCLTLALSGRFPVNFPPSVLESFGRTQRGKAQLAMDGFGVGCSCLPLLHSAEPDYLKVAKFFVDGIEKDLKKKILLRHIVNTGHQMGSLVIADGVQTEGQFSICKDLGCDYLQGPLVQSPTPDPDALLADYPEIERLSNHDRRQQAGDRKVIKGQIETLEPIPISTDMTDVFDKFRANKHIDFFPVVSKEGSPLGIVHERDLKEYTYSRYGKELISNKTCGRRLRDFVRPCPVADINTKTEKILELFAHEENTSCVLIVKGGRYVGFLSAQALLRVINEKSLAIARDQNPLTKLPGNNVITEYLANVLRDTGTSYAVVYFDLDNFKPFNDKYGFRQGDRAILLFAEILTQELQSGTCFIGHVGGDDFFAGFKGVPREAAAAAVLHTVDRFSEEARSLYDDEARKHGMIAAKDRHGVMREFPLLTVSAAMIVLPDGRSPMTSDEISSRIAEIKKVSKSAADHLAIIDISL